MAREGWSTKSAAAVLGMAPTKITQAIDPAFRKIATLMLADPIATHRELLAWMERVRAETLANGIDLEERIRMLAAARVPRMPNSAAGR